MSNISSIEWNEFPLPKTRPMGLAVRPEYEAVRALKIGEAIKFPCTWNHTIRFDKYEICNGRAGCINATRKSPEKYVQAVCIDKVIYVRRLQDRGEV